MTELPYKTNRALRIRSPKQKKSPAIVGNIIITINSIESLGQLDSGTKVEIKIDTGIPEPTMSEDLIPRASIVTNITNIVALLLLAIVAG